MKFWHGLFKKFENIFSFELILKQFLGSTNFCNNCKIRNWNLLPNRLATLLHLMLLRGENTDFAELTGE